MSVRDKLKNLGLVPGAIGLQEVSAFMGSQFLGLPCSSLCAFRPHPTIPDVFRPTSPFNLAESENPSSIPENANDPVFC